MVGWLTTLCRYLWGKQLADQSGRPAGLGVRQCWRGYNVFRHFKMPSDKALKYDSACKRIHVRVLHLSEKGRKQAIRRRPQRCACRLARESTTVCRPDAEEKRRRCSWAGRGETWGKSAGTWRCESLTRPSRSSLLTPGNASQLSPRFQFPTSSHVIQENGCTARTFLEQPSAFQEILQKRNLPFQLLLLSFLE